MTKRSRWRLPTSLVGALALAGCGLAGWPGTTAPVAPHLGLPAAPVVPSQPLAPVTMPGVERHVQATATNVTLDGRLLVISADGNEADLPAIKRVLDTMGTPYDVWIATAHPSGLTPDQLAVDAGHGRYQGVILTTGSLPVDVNGTWSSALTATEWQNLWAYEAAYGVRQVSWYTYPTADYGFGSASATDTAAAPLAASFTTTGAGAFPGLNTANGLTITYAYTYLAKPLDGTLQPWLTDAAGNCLMGLKTYPDGRQNLAMTFDANPYLVHAQAVAFGVVNWVTGGAFLGDRLTAMCEEVDDVFLDDDMWVAGGTTGGSDRAYTPGDAVDPAPTFRISGADFKAFTRWQEDKRKDPTLKGLTTTLCFNGWGTTKDFLDGRKDTLTPEARAQQARYYWVSHTWDHQNLDATGAATTTAELVQNNELARKFGFKVFTPQNLVQPDVSGLGNAVALQAGYDTGLRFVVSDTSHPDQVAPVPNTGIVNALVPGIFEVPRHPVNLFYNVSTPDEWISEYNQIYRTYWGRDLTYPEVLDKVSDQLAAYMRMADLDPWMFHQPNMRAYDGKHSLLGDLTDATIAKYQAVFELPVLFPTQDQVGVYFQHRMAYLAGGVSASIVPGKTLTLTAQRACVAPVIGPYTPDARWMGDHWVTYVALSPGQSVTLRLDQTQDPPGGTPTWPGLP